jgi:hypothetical protein
MEEAKIQAVFDSDTKRTHRFLLRDREGDIKGTIYCPKDSAVPKRILVEMVVEKK